MIVPLTQVRGSQLEMPMSSRNTMNMARLLLTPQPTEKIRKKIRRVHNQRATVELVEWRKHKRPHAEADHIHQHGKRGQLVTARSKVPREQWYTGGKDRGCHCPRFSAQVNRPSSTS